jgi:hypothetical protein
MITRAFFCFPLLYRKALRKHNFFYETFSFVGYTKMQVDKGRILHETLARLAKLMFGEGLLLQPFKKDRSICLVVLDDAVRILERGFVENDYVVDARKIKKELKVLCRREFPRSNKVWLTRLTHKEVESFVD